MNTQYFFYYKQESCWPKLFFIIRHSQTNEEANAGEDTGCAELSGRRGGHFEGAHSRHHPGRVSLVFIIYNFIQRLLSYGHLNKIKITANGRGQRRSLSIDRASRDCQSGSLSNGQSRYRYAGLRRRVWKAIFSFLRHHQSQLWSQTGGRRYHVRIDRDVLPSIF